VTVLVQAPEDMGRKAKVLREAMFDSVGTEDVEEVMQILLKKAKEGDPKSQEILFKLLGASRG
jgi:hypothetical protein